ncbi:GNAT family N-acetyltransferase, partial [Pseudomonas aeruginosa]|nr:GNAT family N-acetyltransferase [Pseudomonas aeruginosa]
MSLDWTCKHHADLTLKELYALLQLRTEVFVVEQKCPYQEVDGLDLVGDTHHLMAWRD